MGLGLGLDLYVIKFGVEFGFEFDLDLDFLLATLDECAMACTYCLFPWWEAHLNIQNPIRGSREFRRIHFGEQSPRNTYLGIPEN